MMSAEQIITLALNPETRSKMEMDIFGRLARIREQQAQLNLPGWRQRSAGRSLAPCKALWTQRKSLAWKRALVLLAAWPLAGLVVPQAQP